MPEVSLSIAVLVTLPTSKGVLYDKKDSYIRNARHPSIECADGLFTAKENN